MSSIDDEMDRQRPRQPELLPGFIYSRSGERFTPVDQSPLRDLLLDFIGRLPSNFGKSDLYLVPKNGTRVLQPLVDLVPGNLTNTRIFARARQNHRIRADNARTIAKAGAPPRILVLHLEFWETDYFISILKESSGQWWVHGADLPYVPGFVRQERQKDWHDSWTKAMVHYLKQQG